MHFQSDQSIRGNERPENQLCSSIQELHILDRLVSVECQSLVADALPDDHFSSLFIEHSQLWGCQQRGVGDRFQSLDKSRDVSLDKAILQSSRIGDEVTGRWYQGRSRRESNRSVQCRSVSGQQLAVLSPVEHGEIHAKLHGVRQRHTQDLGFDHDLQRRHIDFHNDLVNFGDDIWIVLDEQCIALRKSISTGVGCTDRDTRLRRRCHSMATNPFGHDRIQQLLDFVRVDVMQLIDLTDQFAIRLLHRRVFSRRSNIDEITFALVDKSLRFHDGVECLGDGHVLKIQ